MFELLSRLQAVATGSRRHPRERGNGKHQVTPVFVWPAGVRVEALLSASRSQRSAAAEKLGVSRTTLDRVLNGRGGISADMTLHFETVGWSNAEFWMRYQASYDLENAQMRARKRAGAVVAETR